MVEHAPRFAQQHTSTCRNVHFYSGCRVDFQAPQLAVLRLLQC